MTLHITHELKRHADVLIWIMCVSDHSFDVALI